MNVELVGVAIDGAASFEAAFGLDRDTLALCGDANDLHLALLESAHRARHTFEEGRPRATAEDAWYQIAVPTIAPIRGRANILAELLRMKSKVADQKHEMKNVAASGNVVFTERVDQSLRNGRWVPIPLVAVFEVNARGEISAWREYLDLGHAANQHGMTFEALRETLLHSH